MLRFVFATLLALSLAGPPAAQEDPVTGVIAAQIEAFRQDDFAAAFGFASPMIRGLFGTPERFGAMVRRGYPMVWRPAEVQYLDQRIEGPFTYQKVRIRDGAGTYHMLEYQMLPTPDGWRINGVWFLDAADLAA